MDDKFVIAIIIMIILLSICQIVQGQENQKLYFDTTKIKCVEIIHDFNFGFPQRDTVEATYIVRKHKYEWYCKGVNGLDYLSSVHPKLLYWRKK